PRTSSGITTENGSVLLCGFQAGDTVRLTVVMEERMAYRRRGHPADRSAQADTRRALMHAPAAARGADSRAPQIRQKTTPLTGAPPRCHRTDANGVRTRRPRPAARPHRSPAGGYP